MKMTETTWSFNCNTCSKCDYEQIEDAVYGRKILQFLAAETDSGEGAVQNELISMDDFNPDGWVNIAIEIPSSSWDSKEDEIQAMLGKIDDALDEFGGAWNCNC